MKFRSLTNTFAIAGVLAGTVLTTATGCKTGAQTGAVAGGGIGALAGQAIGGNTKSTVIGAAVGVGVGYIVGNEADKKKAKAMEEQKAQTTTVTYVHKEVGPLGGTRWMLVSLSPKDRVPPHVSKIVEFRSHGRVITTTTKLDGSVEVADENYRVVGSTLIVNKPGYIVNAQYSISGDQLIVSAEEFRAVLRRIR